MGRWVFSVYIFEVHQHQNQCEGLEHFSSKNEFNASGAEWNRIL